MKHPLAALAAFVAALLPVGALAATDASMSATGAGGSGYDWLVGTWACTNTMPPSQLGALQSTPVTLLKLKDGSIAFHTNSTTGDVTGYYAYVPKTKTWYTPFSDSSGNYGYESTQQSGKTILWTGMFYVTDSAPVPIRDTYTMLNTSKYYDLSEAKVGGAWKAVAKTTCTKS